ncbi:MAG: uroporphyrinogen decarboxylase family protein [Armatimonadota bacterium]
MSRTQMTSRERILTTIRHEEPDRVPISPRVGAWMVAQYGQGGLAKELEVLPDMDFMYIIGEPGRNYIYSLPEQYDLPGVEVEQTRREDGDTYIIERTFRTPAGEISDVTRVPPAGREYGVSPNPVKLEHLIKSRDDLDAVRAILPPPSLRADTLRAYEQQVGDRGVIMVCVRSALDHNAGDARGMQNLMVDYYADRALFDEILALFHQHSLEHTRAALEAGAQFIFGSWYHNSLSSGWSPAIFEEVFVPQIRDHVELTHSYGALYDYYDDGKLARSMELIVGCGVDVLETCTPPPVGDFDLAEAKRTIGPITTIKGYVDLLYVVKHGTPELVERRVREAMEIAKPGGGFIIGSSDSFREGTPRENIETYFRACKQYGVYG